MEIKPCPYPDCGGEGVMGGSPGAHFVYCKACGCTGPAQQNKPAAAGKWNSVPRTEPVNTCATCADCSVDPAGITPGYIYCKKLRLSFADDFGCILWTPR